MPSGGWEGPMEEVGRMLREKEGKRGHSRENSVGGCPAGLGWTFSSGEEVARVDIC